MVTGRGRPNAEQLFNRYPLYAIQEGQRQKIAEAIAEADTELIRTGNVEELAGRLSEGFSLNTPRLLEGALSIDVEEAQVDVTGDFRHGAFGAGPTYVTGIRVSYYVPFLGDREMFRCTASTRNVSMRPVELGDAELTFAYERSDQDVSPTKVEFDRELAQIRQALGWLEQDCRNFNASLPALAREAILARRSRLAQMSQGIESLGLPIRRAIPATSSVQRVPSVGRIRREPDIVKKVENYDIALSYAGENRAYVEEVANGLKAVGVRVFYDGFEKANLWGKNLIEHLAEIYANSGYVVMFISKEYVEKVWTTHERRHAQQRALLAQDEYILPARFDDTPVPGMTTTVASQDLRHITPAELVTLILIKLRRE